MSLRFRRLLKIAPGLKLVVSKKGLGLNLGVRGAHASVNTRGQVTRSIGIPGTGLSNVKRTRLKTSTKGNQSSPDHDLGDELNPLVINKPKPKNFPSIFASSAERTFFKALISHDLKTYEALFNTEELALVSKAIALQLALQDDDKFKEAANWLADIWENKSLLANNKYFKKYVEKIIVVVPVAPGISFPTYLNLDALGLLYVEVLQQLGKTKQAKQIIEEITPTQVTAISLAEIEIQLEQYDEVLSLTQDLENEDDATCILLVFRAIALREQKHYVASREVFNQALKSKKRNQDILHKALFERSKTYLEEGKKSQAKADLEKILATDSDYPSLKESLAKLN